MGWCYPLRWDQARLKWDLNAQMRALTRFPQRRRLPLGGVLDPVVPRTTLVPCWN